VKSLSIAAVLPVPDLAAAVRFWSATLGVEPTFVDGERWAQFDLAGRRLALAGSDRPSEKAGVMVKVEDLEHARTSLEAAGLEVGEIERGPHEDRLLADSPGGWPLTLYSSRSG
jgi:catechol 2,3-dioxygenase-like lactoylglutathione lyase family enzyme